MTRTDSRRVAEARRWFRGLGYEPVDRDGLTVVRTSAHPDTWDANWLLAGPGVGGDTVLTALTAHFGDGWQVVQTDCLTEPEVEAALALAGFRVENTLIEMMTRQPVAAHPIAIDTTPVTDANWEVFARLIDADMREGKRTGEHDDAVAAGLLDGMRRRLGACDYWLLHEGGAAIGYGMTAACPGGLGLIENLFTLPEHRGRGVMSGFIVDAARRLREGGCDAVFLDAHAHDTPKRLYARLCFRPVALTRTWVRRPV